MISYEKGVRTNWRISLSNVIEAPKSVPVCKISNCDLKGEHTDLKTKKTLATDRMFFIMNIIDNIIFVVGYNRS